MRTIASILTALKVSDFLCLAGTPEWCRIFVSPLIAFLVFMGLTTQKEV